MKFYWCAQTRASRIAWMLEEIGVEYERVVIDVRDPKAKSDPEFRRASPMGKVPAIADGEAVMSDSAAIAMYLADRYALGKLSPQLDDPQRAAYLYWMIFTPGVLEPAMAEKAGGWDTNPGQHGWGDWPSMIQTLEQRLTGRDWLLDFGFSAADVVVGSSCVFLRMFKMLPASPVLEAYADRCLARPAYQRALAMDSSTAQPGQDA